MFQSYPRRFVPAADREPSSEKLHRTKGARVLVRLFCVALVAIAGIGSPAVAQTAEFSQGNKTANVVSLEVPLGSYPGRGINL